MTRISLRASLVGLARHPVRSYRVIMARLRAHPARVAVVAARSLPPRLVTVAADMLVRSRAHRPFPTFAALVLDRAGRPDMVRRVMERAARRRGSRVRTRLVTLVVAFESPHLAEDLLVQVDDERHRRRLTAAARVGEARVAWSLGQMSAAVDMLAPFVPHDRRVASVHEQYRGERASLQDRPIPPGPPTTVASTRGRVLHCVTNALPYTHAGYTVRTQSVVTAQRRAGLDPRVVTGWGWPLLQGRLDAEDRAEIDGIPHYRLLPRGSIPGGADERLALGAEAVTELVRRVGPAVLHAATDHRNGSVALAVRERTGLPVVYEVRGFLEETWLARVGEAAVGSERHLLQRERETTIMRSADAVVTLAATMRDEIVARGISEERIFLAPNAVDASLLTATPDGSRIRERYGIGADEVVVGSVSSLVSYEGFATLLDAAAILRDKGLPVRLLLIGDGDHRAALLERARRTGLSGTAVLPGRVPPAEALAAHAALDVFVAPRADVRVCRLVTPLKPVEAMALGRAVVLSDLPALAELAAGGTTGVLVPPDDPGALATVLAELRDDPGRRAELGAAAREQVAAERTWDQVARTYRSIYARLGCL